jgi:regulator of sigma E protease
LKKDDIVLSVDDSEHPEKPGVRKIESRDDFTNIVRGSAGRRLTLNIQRNNEPRKIDVTPKKDPKSDVYLLGLKIDMAYRKVSNIDPESEAYKAGLRDGYFIMRFYPRKEEANEKQWTDGTLVWKTTWDAKKEESAKISVPGSSKYNYYQPRMATELYRDEDFARALGAAWEDLYHFSGSVFSIVRGLVSGDVSHKALSGAIGIGQSMFIVASDQTFMNFLWFLGFISLNLGVLQFMPIPLLDGWHLLMLAVEKVKGGPIPMEWHIRFQYVGLVMIGGLLLLSFYNDISRLIFGV